MNQPRHIERFTYLRDIEHVTREGDVIRLALWQGICAECGEPFVLKTPARESTVFERTHAFGTRRCPQHRRFGRVEKPCSTPTVVRRPSEN